MNEERIFDQIVLLFASSSEGIYTELLPLTLGVAAALFTLQLAWDLGRWTLVGEAQLVGKALRKLILFLLLYNLITLAPMWLPQTVEGFAYLGERLTGIGLSPSAVFGQGLDLGLTFFNSWERVLSVVFLPASQMRSAAMWIIFAAFGLLAIQLARTLIEISFAVGGLTICLAFSGHRMTFGLLEGYLRYVLELGIRLFVLHLVIRVGQDFGRVWDEALRGLALLDLRLHLTILGASILFAVIGVVVPGQIASRIAGSFSLSGHNPLADQ